MPRLDRASTDVAATPAEVYAAFVDGDAVAEWLPPEGMTGEMRDFDAREGGGFTLALTYEEPGSGRGKTTPDTDVSRVGFVELEPDRRVVWAVEFESDDPEYADPMTMTWTFTGEGRRTRVAVDATDVPPGIDQEVHQQGMAASLANLARYLESS